MKHIVKLAEKLKNENTPEADRLKIAQFHLGIAHGFISRVKTVCGYNLQGNEAAQKVYQMCEDFLNKGET